MAPAGEAWSGGHPRQVRGAYAVVRSGARTPATSVLRGWCHVRLAAALRPLSRARRPRPPGARRAHLAPGLHRRSAGRAQGADHTTEANRADRGLPALPPRIADRAARAAVAAPAALEVGL